MKRLLSILLCAVFMAYILCACGEKPEIETMQAVEVKYTAVCDRIETEMAYRYNWLSDEFVLVPDTHTVHYDEKYEVRYNITYVDGTAESEWHEVDKDTYEKVKDELPP